MFFVDHQVFVSDDRKPNQMKGKHTKVAKVGKGRSGALVPWPKVKIPRSLGTFFGGPHCITCLTATWSTVVVHLHKLLDILGGYVRFAFSDHHKSFQSLSAIHSLDLHRTERLSWKLNLKFVVKFGCFLSWCLLTSKTMSLKITFLKSPTPTAFGELGHLNLLGSSGPEWCHSKPWVRQLNVSFELLGNRQVNIVVWHPWVKWKWCTNMKCTQ